MQIDPFIQKIQEQRINDRYSLVRKLGEGGFGAVFLGCDFDTTEEVAIKLECKTNSLAEEYEAYQPLQGLSGFPKVHWYGQIGSFHALVLELLGPSLEDLFVFCDHRFSLKTTLLIADQLLQRFETLHATGYLHRDVKPQNCLLGTGTSGNLIYITDFGLVKAFRPIETTDSGCGEPHLVGTVRYASINAHYGRPCCAKDDLESFGYMLIYFMRGYLPWQGLHANSTESKECQVLKTKLLLEIEKLCDGLPEEFVEYMKYVDLCTHDQVPDYDKLRNMFRMLANREGIEYDDVFDWTVRMFLYQTQQADQSTEQTAEETAEDQPAG